MVNALTNFAIHGWCTGSMQTKDTFTNMNYPRMEKSLHPLQNEGWNYLFILKLQRLHSWSFGLGKYIHPTLYWRLIHVSKNRTRLGNNITLLLRNMNTTTINWRLKSLLNIYDDVFNSRINTNFPSVFGVAYNCDNWLDTIATGWNNLLKQEYLFCTWKIYVQLLL